MKKTIIIWVIAIVITIGSAVWQRMSGPTYPVRASADVAGEEVTLRLPRSNEGVQDFAVEVDNESGELDGTLFWRYYPVLDENAGYTAVPAVVDGDVLKFPLPDQPAAGKLEYYLNLTKGGSGITSVRQDDPIVIRFTDPVDAYILIPHILMMFIGMLFTNVAAVMAILKVDKYRFYLLTALLLLVVGGLILGPLVQWQAFGDLWTGWPFGNDLTDNKLAIAVIAMAIAYFANMKQERRWLVVVAAVVVLIVFSIPHSAMGSEFDRTKGEVVTG